MKHPPAVDTRALILGRVKESLARLPTPPASPPLPRQGLDTLPPVAANMQETTRFLAMRMEELGASFVLCDEPAQVVDGLAGLFRRNGWRRVAAVRSPGLEALLAALPAGVEWVDPAEVSSLADVEGVIVEADAVDAQFGTVFCAGSGLGAVALAPHLVVVAGQSRLHGEFASALRRVLALPGGASAGITCLTGASVNAQIERKPIAKGHGPQGLTVLLYHG